MTDLVRTIDNDEEDGAEEAAGNDGPILATKGFSLGFRDLVSDDEADLAAPTTWNFDSHETGEIGAADVPLGGLRAKIRDRLLEKREEQGLHAEDPEGDGVERKVKKAKKAKKGQPTEPADDDSAEADQKAAVIDRASAEHLRTDIHFADLRLSRPLLRAITDARFSTPTPIQRDVIPPALKGLDILATAETGSGKTASFLLPVLERLCQSSNVRTRKRDSSGRILMGKVATKAMVLIPTRELAVQCHAMMKNLAKYTLVTYQLVAGGYQNREQANSLRQQPDVVIATPGRLLDHLLNSHSVHLELLEIVVFDEADRLLELGFRDECQQVLKRCSRGRQTMLFSATMNTSVEELSTLALVKPVRVHANPVNRVAEMLEQEFVKAPGEAYREAVLMSLVTRNYKERVIVFCATRSSAHRLAIVFGLCGLKFTEIHGNLSQAERVDGLQQFQRGEADYLLATDLAARGLDLSKVETVINFHLPLDSTRYIHRVGRTARMGRAGRAVTIYCPEEYGKVKQLGKQCCTKVKSKVVKRTVASEAVQEWVNKIKDLKEDVDLIVGEESFEREDRQANLLLTKQENMQKYAKDIKSRPERTWYVTNNEKRDLRTEDHDRVKAIEATAAELPIEGSERKKRKRGEEKKEKQTPEEKRKKRMKDKLKQAKAKKHAETGREQARARASARRVRKGNKPPRMGSGQEEKKGDRKRR